MELSQRKSSIPTTSSATTETPNQEGDASSSSKKKILIIKMSIGWRIIFAFMGIFFLMATYVQHNDPDGYLWMPAYFVPCILSLAILLSKNDDVTITTTSSKRCYKDNSREKTIKNLPSTSPSSSSSSSHPVDLDFENNEQKTKIDKKDPSSSTTTATTSSGRYENQHAKKYCPLQKQQKQQQLDKKDDDYQLTPTTFTPTTSSSTSTQRTSYYFYKLINMNNIIAIHILYCFGLGIWTLILFANGITTQRELIMKYYKKKNHYQKSAIREINNDDVEDEIEFNLIQMEMNAEEAKEVFGLCLVIAWLSLLRNYNFLRFGKLGLWLGVLLTILPFIAWIFVEMYEIDLIENAC